MNNGGTRYVGPSVLAMLGVLFVGLKLTGYIDWPWWLVTAPIWGSVILGIVILVGCFAFLIWYDNRKRP